MPKQLINLSISSPGFFGLNKQERGTVQPPGWASEATNVIFDDAGRVASRKGYKNIFSSNPTGTPKAIHEHIDGAGTTGLIFATNNTIQKDDADGTFTDVTGTATTPTADNWQFANFNGKVVGFQTGHAPIVAATVGANFADVSLLSTVPSATIASGGTGYTAADVLTLAGGTGTAATFTVATVDGSGVITSITPLSAGSYTADPSSPNSPTGGTGTGASLTLSLSGELRPTTAASCVTAAFGRLWTLDGTDLKYCNLLDETTWDGVFDLSIYWKSGMDEGVAIAEFNGYLIVFGKNNMIIWDNPDDPTSAMSIVENIGGIGCVARDSVQDIGTDMLFLSRTGVRSLGRTIQEKSNPVRDISKNIKDYLIGKYSAETGDIKSAYNSEEGFYALSFPSNATTFVFDLKAPMQDGSYRVTEWGIGPTALEYALDSKMYMGFATRVAEHTSYYDDLNRDSTGGSSYLMEWLGGWNDFGEEARPFVKIPKKLSILMGGVSAVTVTAKWAFDYRDSFQTEAITFTGGALARYGTAKYAVDVYAGAIYFEEVKTPMRNTGQVIKFGVNSNVSGEQVILQRLDLLAKTGRYAI